METISYLGLLYLILLVIPVLFINSRLQIKMNKQILISILRMVIQLSLVGLYLQYIFDLNVPLLNLGYLVLMMLIASFSVTNSTGLNLKRIYFPIFISMFLPNIALLFFFNAVVIDLSNVFDARYMITIGGMLLGNVLNGDIIGLNTFYKGVKENEKTVNYDLALGATRFQALMPFFKNAIIASIKPTVATMATIGLVSLPGMMTGQILGGSVPREAIMYQIAIMIAIFVTRYFNIFGAIALSQRLMFDKNDQLIKD